MELHGTRHPTPILPSGDQSALEPPGPIPNPEVKRRSADGSGTIGPVRVGRRQVFARLQLTLGPGSFFARMSRGNGGLETVVRLGNAERGKLGAYAICAHELLVASLYECRNQ